jgi:mono/diheme cytochrome c family protein
MPMRVEDRSATGPRHQTAGGRALAIGVLIGILGSVVVAFVVIGPLVLAKRNDAPLERAYGDFAVSIASRLGSGNAQNPQAQNQRALIAGRDAYTGSCGMCHGATGDGRGVFGTATYPHASDLRMHDAVDKSDAQLFWIIKNGLAFTGMPGFADQYDDQATWSLVSYVRSLQDPSRVQQPGNPQPGGPPLAGGRGPGRGGPFTLGPIDVPTPTAAQLDRADPTSSDATARGAAVYFAQGCHTCHAATGDMLGDLGLRRGGSPEDVRAVRQGRVGMPAYDEALISDSELRDLQAYLATIGTSNRLRD